MFFQMNGPLEEIMILTVAIFFFPQEELNRFKNIYITK